MTEIQMIDSPQVSLEPQTNGHQKVHHPATIALLTPPLNFDYESLVTEDDEPVDNIFSEKQQRLLTEALHVSSESLPFAGPFVALANVGLFYQPNQSPIVPDVLLSLGVQVPDNLWQKHHRSYFTWQFGKVPEVVIEVVSNKKGNEESTKCHIYAQIGVLYYIIFDPQQALSQEVLRIYKLDRQTQIYQQISQTWFPEVSLGLRLWAGEFENIEEVWLRWCDSADVVIPNAKETAQSSRERVEQADQWAEQEYQRAELEHQRAELERQRAEQADQRVEQERQRVEQERQQKEQLIAQLKALGIEPQFRD